MIRVELIKQDPIDLFECFGCRKDTKVCLEISARTREGLKKALQRFPICEDCLKAMQYEMKFVDT